MSERRSVVACAVCSAIILAAAAAVRATPVPYAPRVNIRWAVGLGDSARAALERHFDLRHPAQRDRDTWAYDLGIPTPDIVKALIAHPSVEDTHHIDRRSGVISPEAPRGTTLVRDDLLARCRVSPALYWLLLLSGSSVLVSTTWLLATRSQRHAVNDPL